MYNVKRSRIVILLIIMMIINSSLVFGEDYEFKEEEKVVKVGYHIYSGIINDLNSFNYQGFGYDVFKKIEDISQLKFEFVDVSDELFNPLDTGKVDIIGFFLKTENRDENYVYGDMVYETISTALVGKKDQYVDVELFYDNPSFIDGKTIATYEDNLANSELIDYALKNNIDINLEYYEMGEYLSVDADLYLTNINLIKTDDYFTALNFKSQDTYLIGTEQSKDIIEEIDEIITYLSQTEGNFLEEIDNKYLNDHDGLIHRSLTKDEVEILRNKVFNVGLICNNNPMSYKVNDGYSGIGVESFNLISERYSFDVVYNGIVGCDVINEYDILITHKTNDLNIYNKYQKTENYLDISMYLFAPYTNTVEQRQIFGSLNYIYLDREILASELKGNDIIDYNNIEDLYNGYLKGDIDGFVVSEIEAQYLLSLITNEQFYAKQLEISLPLYFLINNEIADEYLNILNVAIDTIDHHDFEDILYNESSNYMPNSILLQDVSKYFTAAIIALIVVLLIVFIIFYIQQKEKNKAVLKAYNYDNLTGLLSFNNFSDLANKRLENAASGQYELITFDIDLFKTINSLFGYQKGDDVLKVIGMILKDNMGDSLLCRKGDDCFIILRETENAISLENVYYLQILPAVFRIIDINYNFSMSFGVVKIHNSKEMLSDLIGYADAARTRNKNLHELTYTYFDENMQIKYANNISITLQMKDALHDKEFTVYYQPKISYITGKISGAEALVRWIKKDGSMIYPSNFIEVFEKNGFIFNLDLYVFENVCKFIKEYKEEYNLPLISTNLSAITMFDDRLEESLINIINKYKISTSYIELEITETALTNANEYLLAKVRKLKDLGFYISIDDFGSGESSLNRLSEIDVNTIKIDKSFIDNYESNDRVNIIIENVIRMSKQLNLKIITEGVENLNQAIYLKSLNCDSAQGYYFEKPMNEESFLKLLSANKNYKI